MAVVALTLVGLTLSLAGVLCGGVAFYRTWTEHGDDPLLPRLEAWIQRWRGRLRRLVTRARPRTVAVGGVASAGFAGSARATVTGPQIPEDADLDERVNLLIRRVENVERQAERDRSYINTDLTSIRSRIDVITARHEQATSAVDAKAKSMVLGTVRLQLLGLLLVGVGTIFLAAATFAGQ